MLPPHRSIGPRRLYPSLVALLVLGFALGAPAARAGAFDCRHNRCGLLTDGAYRNYVIGTLTHVANRDDMERVYRWAKHHGYWKSLPGSLPPYLTNIKMVTITPDEVPGSRPVIVFMQRSEYEAAPLRTGDLVRYTPHTSDAEAPKGDPPGMTLFRGLTGCVATLCAQSDKACLKRYQKGLFTTDTGRPVSLGTGKIIQSGSGIDPVSLLPKQ